MQINLTSIDFLAYSNIPKLCACRKIKITTNIFADIREFNEHKNSVGYFILECSNNTIIIFLCSSTDFHKKSKFVKIRNLITNDKNAIIIKSENVNLKTDLKCEILDLERYLLYDWYEAFIAKGRSLRLVSKEEFKQEWKQKFFMQKKQLPKILNTHHEIVWFGLKPGDICEIDSPSLSSSGKYSQLRLVCEEIIFANA
jgi:DNA-directed RNA polymerase subunit H (RpoH/RPB5)